VRYAILVDLHRCEHNYNHVVISGLAKSESFENVSSVQLAPVALWLASRELSIPFFARFITCQARSCNYKVLSVLRLVVRPVGQAVVFVRISDSFRFI
jgi:hypothetical protein